MTKSDHQEMKAYLISSALSLAVSANVPVHEIKERTDALREVIEQISELEYKE